ncbi:hypothetical protein IAT40_003603 [Kwoniella sp. CBS 6097]
MLRSIGVSYRRNLILARGRGRDHRPGFRIPLNTTPLRSSLVETSAPPLDAGPSPSLMLRYTLQIRALSTSSSICGPSKNSIHVAQHRTGTADDKRTEPALETKIEPKTETETAVRKTLRRVAELQKRVASENSKSVKQGIIAEYPDLRELLEYVYDPDHRTHITWNLLLKYVESQSLVHSDDDDNRKGKPRQSDSSGTLPTPDTLIELLDLLSKKVITGNLAKDTILEFLFRNQVMYIDKVNRKCTWDTERDQEIVDVFGRLLDRNLTAGFGAKTLQDVKWPESQTQLDIPGKNQMTPESTRSSSTVLRSHSLLSFPQPSKATPSSGPSSSTNLNNDSDSNSDSGQTQTPLHPNLASLEKFEVALGKSIEPPFDVLFKDCQASWYASRKLDGVRCLTFLDFQIPSSSSSISADIDTKPKLASIHFVSRTGKPFYSLSNLESQLAPLADLPELRNWLDADPLIVERGQEGVVVKRLILDGEVCVMRPKSDTEMEADQPRDDGTEGTLTTARKGLEGSSASQAEIRVGSTADEIWLADDPFVEDFPSTVSLMRRTDTIQHLSYFIFDVLSYSQVNTKGALSPSSSSLSSSSSEVALNLKFSERIKQIRHVVSWLNNELDKRGVKEKMVKDLKQIKIGSADEVEGMVRRAAQEGWEGLVFRKDEVYKGKRSPDIRKFKKWQDAEYVVESIDTSSMRLSINGVFGTYEALSNVWISHEGHKVSVGSGFTADQRIRYAQNPEGPEGIVGKMITVEYFSESVAANRGGGQGGKSLRFPRVKMVWVEGKRGM